MRNIPVDWACRVVDAPEHTHRDKNDPELTHYIGRIKEFGNRALRVILNVENDPPRIVTAYFDRRLKGTA